MDIIAVIAYLRTLPSIEKTIPDENTPLIIYCSGGFRSILVAYNLQKMGYKNILSLKGGFSAYLNLSKA